MDEMLIMQLNEIAARLGWVLVVVKDEDEIPVMISIGDEGWVDEFFGAE